MDLVNCLFVGFIVLYWFVIMIDYFFMIVVCKFFKGIVYVYYWLVDVFNVWNDDWYGCFIYSVSEYFNVIFKRVLFSFVVINIDIIMNIIISIG